MIFTLLTLFPHENNTVDPLKTVLIYHNNGDLTFFKVIKYVIHDNIMTLTCHVSNRSNNYVDMDQG